MKKNKRFFAIGLCALLSVLFVFFTNLLASEVSITKRADSYYETVADSGYGGSGGCIDRDGDMKNEYEEEYKEEAVERDEQYENAPSDPEDESSTQEPSEEDDYKDESQHESEERDEQYENAPSNPEDEPYTEEPFKEDELATADQG
jgi:hypothetical protein